MKPRTYNDIFWAARDRGEDLAHCLHLADEWKARKERTVSTVTQADIERTDADTAEHIEKVRARMGAAITNLVERAARHDRSKTQEPERSGYAALQVNLRDVQYGTDEYRAALDAARPVITHHYAANDHHPEHYAGGVGDMSLLSILEMLCDWKAAGERTKQGSIAQSLRVNTERFGLSPQLAAILHNTAEELGWFDEEGVQP